VKSDAFNARYFFHFHTRFTDGELSVNDYFEMARQKQITRLIFLEHIRRQPSYDVGQLVEQITAGSQAYNIESVIGFEAKVLTSGELDIHEDDIRRAAVIGVAEHGFPAKDLAVWQNALTAVFQQYRKNFPTAVLVWVHPGLWLKKSGLGLEHPAYGEILVEAQRLGVLIEQNLRYRLIPDNRLASVIPSKVVRGADAHSWADIESWFASQLCQTARLPS
jgi:histidinol phosphatase-like PHP family hydrolase